MLADFKADKQHDDSSSLESPKRWLNVKNWQTAQTLFEQELLSQFWPLYPSTRKLAERLEVSHNKIAMKLRNTNDLS